MAAYSLSPLWIGSVLTVNVRLLTIDDRLLTTDEVAAVLGVPTGTLYQWRHRKVGPRGVKVGRHVRFRPADVARWIEEQADPIDRSVTR
jgi:excisionase family DNA binding protein